MSDNLANRSAIPARRGLPLNLDRMVGLETAVSLLDGQQATADLIGIAARSLRAKLSAERGISDADLRSTAAALHARARRTADHADKLLALIGAGGASR